MKWHVIDGPKMMAQENMDKDFLLLKNLKAFGPSLIHFYDWSTNAVTYGYFINPKKVFSENAALLFDLAKRPTGGGVVFHQYDFAFSVLVPSGSTSFSENILDNYAFVNQAVIKALEGLGIVGDLMPEENNGKEITASFCMATPTKYDVMSEGKKIGGAAQRKTKQGFLHQGVIFLRTPTREYLQALLKDALLVEKAIQDKGGAVLENQKDIYVSNEFKCEFKQKLMAAITRSP
ncbi:lipoate--protein ligase family protein [Candidatus Clavichlamydia salmonicola]|uniref:lipoate--protein ligase family protein n=1 Tax=Candidatus Clavichlamydia salmonicola TaxID=469812 RepID=UPI001891D119|nr:lipoate--protein ligase family protein [Candidatus Clavichlamydia salmonicola]